MLSHRLRSMQRTLELSLAGQLVPNAAVQRLLLRQVTASLDEAVQLEATIVPRRQRLQAEDLRDGKVKMFPMAAAPEAGL